MNTHTVDDRQPWQLVDQHTHTRRSTTGQIVASAAQWQPLRFTDCSCACQGQMQEASPLRWRSVARVGKICAQIYQCRSLRAERRRTCSWAAGQGQRCKWVQMHVRAILNFPRETSRDPAAKFARNRPGPAARARESSRLVVTCVSMQGVVKKFLSFSLPRSTCGARRWGCHAWYQEYISSYVLLMISIYAAALTEKEKFEVFKKKVIWTSQYRFQLQRMKTLFWVLCCTNDLKVAQEVATYRLCVGKPSSKGHNVLICGQVSQQGWSSGK